MNDLNNIDYFPEKQIVITGIEVILHPLNAMYMPDLGVLFLADIHLGKLSHFRKEGFPIPNKQEMENLERFGYLVEKYTPSEVIILGDLFHSDANSSWYAFLDFLDYYRSTNFTLVKGNHDILSSAKYDQPNLRVTDSMRLDNLYLTHKPETPEEGLINVCGHIHPGVKLRGKGRQTVCLPCFFLSKSQWILPAFGVFTGNHMLRPTREDLVFAVADGEVVQLN